MSTAQPPATIVASNDAHDPYDRTATIDRFTPAAEPWTGIIVTGSDSAEKVIVPGFGAVDGRNVAVVLDGATIVAVRNPGLFTAFPPGDHPGCSCYSLHGLEPQVPEPHQPGLPWCLRCGGGVGLGGIRNPSWRSVSTSTATVRALADIAQHVSLVEGATRALIPQLACISGGISESFPVGPLGPLGRSKPRSRSKSAPAIALCAAPCNPPALVVCLERDEPETMYVTAWIITTEDRCRTVEALGLDARGGVHVCREWISAPPAP